jgi:hypothetical protein
MFGFLSAMSFSPIGYLLLPRHRDHESFFNAPMVWSTSLAAASISIVRILLRRDAVEVEVFAIGGTLLLISFLLPAGPYAVSTHIPLRSIIATAHFRS